MSLSYQPMYTLHFSPLRRGDRLCLHPYGSHPVDVIVHALTAATDSPPANPYNTHIFCQLASDQQADIITLPDAADAYAGWKPAAAPSI